jgi:hypothetical protein
MKGNVVLEHPKAAIRITAERILLPCKCNFVVIPYEDEYFPVTSQNLQFCVTSAFVTQNICLLGEAKKPSGALQAGVSSHHESTVPARSQVGVMGLLLVHPNFNKNCVLAREGHFLRCLTYERSRERTISAETFSLVPSSVHVCSRRRQQGCAM